MNMTCMRRTAVRVCVGVTALLLGLGLGGSLDGKAQPTRPTQYTMMFRGVALETALGRIADTTQINLVYDSELVKGETIFCSARNASRDELLRCLLSGVPIDYYQTSAGTYVLTPSPRHAPRYGNLAGVVVDAETKEPLPHAHVLLAAAETGVASNEAGRFQVPGLTSGLYRIVATHLGYETAVDSVRVPPDDSVQHRIALKPKAVQSNPVVVNGVERRMPGKGLGSSELSADELQKPGRWGTPDAMGRAATVIGVHRQSPRADLHIQGGDTGEHEVRLDGIPIRNPVTLRRLLGAFSPLALNRLTVHKAGFGVEHGSTVSGIVSTEHALSGSTPKYGQVEVDPMSVNGEGHASIEVSPGRTAQVRVAARSSMWDVYQDPTLDQLLREWNVVDPLLLATYFETGDLPSFQPAAQTVDVGFSDLHAASRIDLGPYRSLSVSGYRGRNHLRTQFVARDPIGMLTRDQYNWANTGGQARLDWTLGARSSASVQLRGSEHQVDRGYQMTYGSTDPNDDIGAAIDTLERVLDPSVWPDDRNRIREWALETTGSYAATTRHHLKGAVEVSRLTSRFGLGGRFLRRTVFQDTRWQVDGYLRDVMSLGTGTTVSAGTRLAYIPTRHTLYAEPRVQVHQEGALRGGAPYALRAAGGLYRQYVNRFDASSTSPTAILPSMRFWLPVGDDHAPPKAYHVSIDGRIDPRNQWTVTGETYYKHYDHLLTLDYGVLSGDTEMTVAPSSALAATTGYALGGGVALIREGALLRTTVRYDWSRSRRRFPSRFGGRIVPVPWNQPHEVSLSTEFAFTDALSVQIRGEHGWGRRWGFRQTYYDYLGVVPEQTSDLGWSFEEPGAHTLAPHTRVDLGGQYRVKWKAVTVDARLNIVNVLDRRNPFDWGVQSTEGGLTQTTRYLPGRRVRVGLALRY